MAKPADSASALDFYNVNDFIVAFRNALVAYHAKFGCYPDLLEPTLFNEKITWSKFFSPKRVPDSGNKLLTANLLPDHVRSQVLVPEVVWRSAVARLDFRDVPAGTYYLKTSHGSGMVQRVELPLAPAETHRLEELFAGYLKLKYGINNGEWWYNTFTPEVFLERSVAAGEETIAWLFYVFAGHVKFVGAYQKSRSGNRSSWLGEDFDLLPLQNPKTRRVDISRAPREILARMRDLAAQIGSASPFVRVDLMIGDDANIYLSELTHAPGDGLTPWPDVINRQLGAAWNLGI